MMCGSGVTFFKRSVILTWLAQKTAGVFLWRSVELKMNKNKNSKLFMKSKKQKAKFFTIKEYNIWGVWNQLNLCIIDE